jgi:hypothetical protein
MAMEPVGHIAGLPQRLLALFLLSWPFLSAFSLAVLLQIGRCHYLLAFRYVQHYQSDYLFKNRRETGQYNSENRI